MKNNRPYLVVKEEEIPKCFVRAVAFIREVLKRNRFNPLYDWIKAGKVPGCRYHPNGSLSSYQWWCDPKAATEVAVFQGVLEDYETGRNALIPLAEKYANEKHCEKAGYDREKWAILWNIAFHRKMDSLARERGLIDG